MVKHLPLAEKDAATLDWVLRRSPKYKIKTVILTGGSARFMEGKQKGYRNIDLIVFSERRAKEIMPFAKELRKIKKAGKIEIVAEYKTEKFSPKIIEKEVKDV